MNESIERLEVDQVRRYVVKELRMLDIWSNEAKWDVLFIFTWCLCCSVKYFFSTVVDLMDEIKAIGLKGIGESFLNAVKGGQWVLIRGNTNSHYTPTKKNFNSLVFPNWDDYT